VILMLVAFPPLVRGGSWPLCLWRSQGSGRATLQGSGGTKVVEGVAVRAGRDTIDGFSAELRRPGVTQSIRGRTIPPPAGRWSGSPNVEEMAQSQTRQPQTLADLQALCDTFIAYYNNSRPLIEPAHPVRPPRVAVRQRLRSPRGCICCCTCRSCQRQSAKKCRMTRKIRGAKETRTLTPCLQSGGVCPVERRLCLVARE
jgi:hypothetical protein